MTSRRRAAVEVPVWSDSAAFDFVVSLLSLIVVGGVYLDGWAHNHDRVDQSFLTPWHAVLYGGVVFTGVFLGVVAMSNHSRGRAWTNSLPAAYRLSFLGVLLFALAGVADLGWHAAFGIEEDTEALLSPTHLTLAFAGVLVVCGPWRAALAKFPAGESLRWDAALPLLLSVAGLIGVLAFMTHFAHPIVDTISARERDAPESQADIYVMNADGSNQSRLTIDSNTWNGFGVWSPDGTRLLMSVAIPPAKSDLYVLNVDGNAVQLTRTPGFDYTPSWSPDGTKVAFVSNLGGENDRTSEVLVVNADGSGQTVLTRTPGREYGTSWSPDSARIVYSSRLKGTWQVFVMNADGSEKKQLTSGGRDSVAADWSPDGRTIAFQREVAGGHRQIHLMDADGGNVRRLEGTGDDYDPAWSPAGDRIAFTAYKAGRADIYVMKADGSEVRNLTLGSGLTYDSAAWSPDGTRLAYTAWAQVSGQDHEVMRRLGVASVMVQAAILMAPLLLLVRRWRLPLGSITLIVLLTSVGAAVIRDHYELMPAALIAGVAGDLLLYRQRPFLSTASLRAFAAIMPAAFYLLYFLTLMVDAEVDWTVHLWAGSVVIAAATGLALTYLIVPPGNATPTSGAASP